MHFLSKTAAAVAAFALSLGFAGAALAQSASLTPQQQVKEMRRGVNVVGYDPMWQAGGVARFQLRHFKVIKDGGFDTVRFNLQAFRHMDAAGKLSPDFLKTLDGLVKAAREQGLTVVLDEHDFEPCAKDVEACRPKLRAFWTQISQIYKDAPPQVAFEILNEPNGGANAVWNDILAENLAIIRQSNPTRNVIIGPDYWNSIDHLNELKLPEADRHLIVTVHYYTPMEFTHQGASWTSFASRSGVTWGTGGDYDQLKANFDKAQTWAAAHDRPIWLGEFGAYDKAAMPDRVAYISAVAREAEARGWAWAYWQFDSDFVVYDIAKDAWIEPIHGALIPEQATKSTEADDYKDNIRKHIISTPQVTSWSVYGGPEGKIRSDAKVQGKAAFRIMIPAASANPWDIGANAPINGRIHKGDLIVLAFWTRLEDPDPARSVVIPALIQKAAAPYTQVLHGDVTVSSTWVLQKIQAVAEADYAPGEVNVAVHLATAKQTIDLGPVFVLNLGPPS